MSSPIYQQFGNGNNNSLLGMIQQYRANPMALLSKRFNLPQDMTDPNQIIQHLLNTGQVSQEQVNKAMQMGNNPQIRKLMF